MRVRGVGGWCRACRSVPPPGWWLCLGGWVVGWVILAREGTRYDEPRSPTVCVSSNGSVCTVRYAARELRSRTCATIQSSHTPRRPSCGGLSGYVRPPPMLTMRYKPVRDEGVSSVRHNPPQPDAACSREDNETRPFEMPEPEKRMEGAGRAPGAPHSS